MATPPSTVNMPSLCCLHSKGNHFHCSPSKRNLSSERVAVYKGRAQNVRTSESPQFCLNKHIDWAWPCYIFSLLFEKVHLSVVNWINGTELSTRTSQGISLVQSFWILKGIFNMNLLSILCHSPTRHVKCRWGWRNRLGEWVEPEAARHRPALPCARARIGREGKP